MLGEVQGCWWIMILEDVMQQELLSSISPHASISLARHQSDFRRGAEIRFDRFDTMLRAVA